MERATVTVLGEMVWLYSHSKLHEKWQISSIHRWLLPALETKQFRIYHRGTKPVGFVSWAWLNESVETAYVLNTSSLRPNSWRSGDRLWFIDLVAPFGDATAICRDLRNKVFPDDVGRFLRAKQSDDTLRIMYVHGKDAVSKARDGLSNPSVLNVTDAPR